MSFFHLEHHGYFYGVARNNVIEYNLGRTVSSQNIWELGTAIKDSKNFTRIHLDQPIHLSEFIPELETRESLDAVNQMAQLGPLRSWMELNSELVNSINANVLSNRGILKKICERTPGDNYSNYNFLVKLDELGRYIFQTEQASNLYEDDLTGFAFENFITSGGSKNEHYDYREKHYSVQSLSIKDWKILYNAEYDGFMNFPLWSLKTNGNENGKYNITKAIPSEMKLCTVKGPYIPDWKFQAWFVQCQLGNIDNLIIGINPNGKDREPLLTEIHLYKTQDLPSLCRHNRYRDQSSMMKNLEDLLLFLDENVKNLCQNGETFKIGWKGGIMLTPEIYPENPKD